MAGQQIRTRDGSIATIEAVSGNTRAAVKASNSVSAKQQMKAKHGFRLTHAIRRAQIGTGYTRQVHRTKKTQDGGSTSVIANRNFMSIMEDEDGNTIPNENTAQAERNLANAEEALKKNAMSSGAAPRESATKPGPDRTAPVTPVSGSRSHRRTKNTASASESGAEEAASASESAENAKASALADESATESGEESEASEVSEPRFRSQRNTVSKVQLAAAEQQQLEQEAARINALAEVREALDDAQRTNERNAAHDAMMKAHRRR
jgi:hypothetical protein